jgi:hypothetical protein
VADDNPESEQLAGSLIDALGVTIELDDNQHLTEVIVLGKIVDLVDNTTGLVIGASAGLDWISQRGIIAAAQHILDDCTCQSDDD